MRLYDNEKAYYEIGSFIGTSLILITIGSLFHKNIFVFYSSIALYLCFGITVLMLLIRRDISSKSLLIICTYVALMGCSYFAIEGSLGSVFNYITTLLFIEMCGSFRFTKKQLLIARVTSLLGIAYIFIKSFSYASSWYYYRYHDMNPNTLGMAILFCVLFFICSSIEIGIKWSKWKIIFHAMLVMAAIISMVNLESRGTLMALASFCVLLFLPKKLLSGKRLLVISIILIIVGVIVPYIFLELYSRHFDLVFLNKSLYTGRERLWSTMLNLLDKAPYGWLLGAGSKTDAVASMLSNVHNDYFVTIFTFGIFGFFLYEMNIVTKLNNAIRNIETRESARYWIYMFISSDIILGYTESVTHWAPLFIFAFLSLGMAQVPSLKENRWNEIKCEWSTTRN